MSPLNFQDEHTEVPKQERPAQVGPRPVEKIDSRPSDLFDDDSGLSSKFLWVAVVVVLVAAIGGGLYLLNRGGYLKIGGHKTPTTAVSPAPTESSVQPSATSATTSSSVKGSYALQVAAFRERTLADKFVQQLGKKDIDSHVVAGSVAGRGTWFKVYTGSFDTRIKAIAAIEGMKKKVGTDVWVVPAE